MKCTECQSVEIKEPEYCCSGYMCGCMGMPIEPPLCVECYENTLTNPTPDSIRLTPVVAVT